MLTQQQLEALGAMLEGLQVYLSRLEQDLLQEAAEGAGHRRSLTLLLPAEDENDG
jgi:hypothetical protein